MTPIQEQEQLIAQAEEAIRRRDMVDRLSANPDFRELFIEGYFKNEVVGLLVGATNLRDPQQRADAVAMAMAGAYAKKFLLTIESKGNEAERTLAANREELELLRAESQS